MTKLTSQEKALSINLQPTIYGTFAEIGGGQEVANHFYQAGAASGTIAKTISAYDMSLSDNHYGSTKRYVSQERLENMLSIEYEQLVVGLRAKANVSHYFVFASNVEITNYHKTNKGRGWMGVKFQTWPNGPVSTCVLHFILHNDDSVEQKKIIGDLGVNLLHGVYDDLSDVYEFITNLTDNLNLADIEINCLEVSGGAFSHTSNRQLSLLLVKNGLTKMIMFGNDQEIIQPLNALHRKDVVLIRGRFNPPTKVSMEMFTKAQNQVLRKEEYNRVNVTMIAEITFNCFEDYSELKLEDLDRRIQMLSMLGITVMVTNFTYHSKLIDFLHVFTTINSLHLVLGLNNLKRVFGEKEDSKSSIQALQFIQSIIQADYRILAFPELNENGDLLGIEDIKLNLSNKVLISYLMTMDRIDNMESIDEELLSIRSEKALEQLNVDSSDWKEMVPSNLVNWLSENRIKQQATVRSN
jgi:hypothetical protein